MQSSQRSYIKIDKKGNYRVDKRHEPLGVLSRNKLLVFKTPTSGQLAKNLIKIQIKAWDGF